MNQTADSAAPRLPPSGSTEGVPAPSVPATGSRDTPRDRVPGHVRGPGRVSAQRPDPGGGACYLRRLRGGLWNASVT